ncbi:hypothetical protein LZ30DRAFT_609835 [Colletotrichum cereale]|nr:hypothetical protein LZ30DRAFT_609835 [Colletotrichum cereale]
MTFERSWLEHVNPRWNSVSNTTALARIVNDFARRKKQNGTIRAYNALGESNDKIRIEGFLAKVFGGYLTDALARSSFGRKTRIMLEKTEFELAFMDLGEQYGHRGGRHTYTRDNRGSILDQWGDESHEPEPLANYTFEEAERDFQSSLALNIHAQRYGYGSGQERKTALFAQAMLFIYLGTVALYGATIVVGYVMEYHLEREQRPGRFQSVVPWSDLQELFVLGLRTPPPSGDDLMDAGAGVSSSRVWEKVIAARADDRDNVQLVFGGTSLKELELNGERKKLYF